MLICTNSIQGWNSTLPTLLLLEQCKTLNDVNQIHSRLITTGFVKNTALTSKIVLAFTSSPHPPLLEFARYLFFTHHAFRVCRKEDDSLFLWNAVIKSYSHGHDPEQALVMLCLMLENGVWVDEFSLSLVLKACSRLGMVREGMQVHGLLRKMGIVLNLFLQNCLIALYVKSGCLGFARQVFDRAEKRDSVSYNSMIDGYVKHGFIDLARELFDSMPMEEKNLISWNSMISGYAQLDGGLKVSRQMFDEMPNRDLISWNSMIDGCVKCGRMEEAQALFDTMPQRDVVSWASMIDGYAKQGEVELARTLFDEMPVRDVVVCNAMMAGYVQNGYFMEALKIFHEMQSEKNLSPDEATLLIVLSAAAQSGLVKNGVAIHHYIVRNKFYLGRKLGVALIDMYSKCGHIQNAMSVFYDIKGKIVDHWNAMIGGLAIHGKGELAFGLLMEVERTSLEPDDITFIGALNACSHAGLVKEGILCFELMRRVHKLEPKLQHYGCIIDILGRAGHLEEATKFIEEMPIEPNDVIWRTLLSACKSHMNFNIGEPVAERLIMLDSHNSSSYVLLSNMYASLGMWNDVSRVRMMMKRRKLKKIPGCSWIEVKGNFHEFFVQDKSHPQFTEIYSLLDNLSTPNSEICHCKQHV